MPGVCSECIALGNASVKMQFECRVYYANKAENQSAWKYHCSNAVSSVALTTRKYDVAWSARNVLGIKMGFIM